jgi:hypothetical protein
MPVTAPPLASAPEKSWLERVLSETIDAFFWRAGDLLQAVVAFAGTRVGLQTPHYTALNLPFVGVWLALAVGIAREHRRFTAADPAEQAA